MTALVLAYLALLAAVGIAALLQPDARTGFVPVGSDVPGPSGPPEDSQINPHQTAADDDHHRDVADPAPADIRPRRRQRPAASASAGIHRPEGHDPAS